MKGYSAFEIFCPSCVKPKPPPSWHSHGSGDDDHGHAHTHGHGHGLNHPNNTESDKQ